MKIRNLIASATVAALTVLPTLAETATPQYDPTANIESVKVEFTNLVEKLKDPMIQVLVAALAIWFIPKLVRYIKHAFNSGPSK